MEGEDKEISITYETLFDILRNEKNRPELQRLSSRFFQDLVRYVQEKRRLAEGPPKEGIFAAEEREKALSQLKNIKKIVAELYAKREKKIIELALDKSRIKSDVDIASLLNEEKEMFEELVILFDKYREGVLIKILDGGLPGFKENKIKEAKSEEVIKIPMEKNEEAGKKEEDARVIEAAETGTKMVRFIYAVPKFIGKELEAYGPFEEEDITTLPIDIANILIAKGRAEEIKEQ